jgi:hypothetical protein
VAITSDVATLRAGQGATITFTFSEDPGASFVHGDVVVTGGTLGALAGSGTTRTALFTPVAGANAGVASITIGAGTYADAAGNGGAAGATPALVFDTLAPNAPSAPHLSGLDDSGVSGSDNVTNAASLTFSGTAEDGATVRLYDGAAAIGSVVASGGTWSIAVAGMAEGPHAISAGATDAAGNASALSGATAVVVDRTAPTLAISSDASALKAGETATITFTFSQDPGSTFGWDGSSGDVAVTGGTLGPVSGTGNVRTAVFTPAAGTNAGSATIEVGGSWSDAAGNAGAAASSPALVFDTQAPTLAITSSAPALKVGETAVITFTFSEDPGASFDTADITVTGGTLGALAGSGAVRTALFTPTPGTNGGSATISVTAAGWQDAGGNAGPGASVPALVFDTLAPAAPSTPDLAAASDKGVSNSDNLTSTATPTITGSAENGVIVTLYDGASVVGSAVASGGNWSIVTSPLGAGAHALTAVAADAAGNVGAASGTLSVSVDRAAPTLSIAIDEAALMAGNPALVTFTFSEDPGASFSWNGTSGDITVAGGKLGALGGGGAVRTALFTPDAAGEGAATITVAAGSYADAAGNAGAGGSVSVSFDNRAPDAPSAPLLAAGSDSGVSDSDGLTNASSLSFEGSAEDGVTVALVDAATGAVLGTAVASGGAWSIAVGRTE